MRTTQLFSATVLLSLGMSLGCASGGGFLGWGKPKPPQPSFASAPAAKPNPVVAAVTDNPVSNAMEAAVKKGKGWVAPKTAVEPQSDVLSLDKKTAKPTPELYISMAEMQTSEGRLAAAERHYQQALQLDPTHLEANLGLARLYDRQGELAKATDSYRSAVRHHLNSSKAHNDLGLCLARQGLYRESAVELESAVRLDPAKGLYRNNLATVAVELGRTDEALQHLTQAHGVAGGHYNLGYLLHERGQDELAATHFRQALQADPSLVQAQAMLAQLNVQSAPQVASLPLAPAPAPVRTAQVTTPRISVVAPASDPQPTLGAPVAPLPPETWPRRPAAEPNYQLTPSNSSFGVRAPSPMRLPEAQASATANPAPSPDDIVYYQASAGVVKLPPVASTP